MARSTLSGHAVPGPSSTEGLARSTGLNLIISIRPGQWTKNLIIFAGLLFGNASVGRHLFDGPTFTRAFAAFLIFCALSGVVYLINDVVDRESD